MQCIALIRIKYDKKDSGKAIVKKFTISKIKQKKEFKHKIEKKGENEIEKERKEWQKKICKK